MTSTTYIEKYEDDDEMPPIRDRKRKGINPRFPHQWRNDMTPGEKETAKKRLLALPHAPLRPWTIPDED